MLTFQPSRDYAAIRAMLVEPRVYRRLREDRMPEASSIEIPQGDNAQWIFAIEDGQPIALFVLVNGSRLHWVFAPQTWGRTAAIAQAFFAWLWKNTELQRVEGRIGSYNRLSIRLVMACGARIRGIAENAGTRHGAHFNNYLFEIEKP